jgi:hypothetical protein
MSKRFFSVLLLGAAFCMAGEKKPLPPAQAANNVVAVTAKPYVGKEAVQQAVGSDLGGDIVVIEVKLVPKGDTPFVINRDDFMLRSDKDGQKSTPFAPSQIAGRGGLVVSYQDQGSVGIHPLGQVPVGVRPTMGSGGAAGNSAGPDSAKAQAKSGADQKEDPLLKTLKEKVLPEKETKEPVSGMLYFLMEGKQKVKDLELLYKTPSGRLSIRFPH